MNSALKNRIKKLEAIQPEKESTLAYLTDEELDEAIFDSCKVLHDNGDEIDSAVSLTNIKCRQFFNSEPWLKDANHRIDVFNKFIKAAIEQTLPEKIKAVFGLGWRNVPIPKQDIELTLKVLHDADLGEEAPWLKGYLENSGVSNEY